MESITRRVLIILISYLGAIGDGRKIKAVPLNFVS
jgi:hypothetical protein